MLLKQHQKLERHKEKLLCQHVDYEGASGHQNINKLVFTIFEKTDAHTQTKHTCLLI